jgi:hypothetical protein
LEKNSYTSGNSHFVLEEGIKKYDDILKEVEPRFLGFIRAQWYKKTGALCFYKGLAITKNEDKDETYIARAQKYYSRSAIQLSLYFRKGVKTKFVDNTNITSFHEALLCNQYPTDYSFSVAECLADLSESILGEIKPSELFNATKIEDVDDENFENTAITLIQKIDKYFFDADSIDGKICVLDWLTKNKYPNHDYSVCKKFDLALNLSLASSFYMLRAGYIESAAREAMHTAEVIAQYLNWYWFDFVTNGEKQQCNSSIIVKMVMGKIIWYAKYLHKLFSAIRTVPGSATRNESSPYLMGDIIPSSALTSLCSIGMSLSFFLLERDQSKKEKEVDQKQVKSSIKKLIKIIEKWTGNENLAPRNAMSRYGYFERKLINSLQRHRYPVLNQLNALKTLVDASLVRGYLSKNETATLKNTKAWLQELHQINQKYNHPLHFTPMQSGHSLYLYWYVKKLLKEERANKVKLSLPDITNFHLHAEFRRLLVQSLDMCHMGRGYYDAIDKMYYLYDDFNDSQIHRNHALQMAAAELTKTALLELKKTI